MVVCHTCWCRLLCVCVGRGARLAAGNVGYVSWRHGVCLGRGENRVFYLSLRSSEHNTQLFSSRLLFCNLSLSRHFTADWGTANCALRLRQHSLPHFPQQTPQTLRHAQVTHKSSGGNTRAPSSKIPRCALEFCSSVGKALTWPPQNGEIFDFTPRSLRWQRWFFLRSDIHWGAFSGS